MGNWPGTPGGKSAPGSRTRADRRRPSTSSWGAGEDTPIDRVLPIEAAAAGGLTFAVGREYLEAAENSDVAAVIIPPHLAPSSKPHIVAPEPRLVFSVIMELAMKPFAPTPARPDGVRFSDPDSVEIGEAVVIGDFCHIGANVKIGRGARIFPRVFIDDDVTIGEDCLIYPGVSIFRGTRIGRKVTIHAGAVIGDDGFGYNQVYDPELDRLFHLKNQHAGWVEIQDWVEIGSQVCIDRGLAGPTTIGQGTIIDNLTQIAHNVETGPDCVIVSQVGIAGNSRLGRQVVLFGQTGVGDGRKIGDYVIVNGGSGVSSDIPAGRKRWWGMPPQPAEAALRMQVSLKRDLPRLRDFWRALKKAGSFEEMKAEFLGASKANNKEEKDQ